MAVASLLTSENGLSSVRQTWRNYCNYGDGNYDDSKRRAGGATAQPATGAGCTVGYIPPWARRRVQSSSMLAPCRITDATGSRVPPISSR
jgi:hypothetical protein